MSRHENYPLDVAASSIIGAALDGAGDAFPVKHLRNLAVQFDGDPLTAEVRIEGRISPDVAFAELWAGIPAAGDIQGFTQPLHAIRVVTTAGDASALEAVVAGELRSSDG